MTMWSRIFPEAPSSLLVPDCDWLDDECQFKVECDMWRLWNDLGNGRACVCCLVALNVQSLLLQRPEDKVKPKGAFKSLLI
jgi:hypothetical protein